jgi:hypothetical protein
MVVRPPRPPRPASPPSGLSILEDELAQERAASLGRLGRALEQALANLASFDGTHPPGAEISTDVRDARRALAAHAGHALWMFVVQREACGLRDLRQVLRDYRVPADVYHRMGVFPGERGSSKQ